MAGLPGTAPPMQKLTACTIAAIFSAPLPQHFPLLLLLPQRWPW